MERSVAPPQAYDQNYYLTNCGGFEQFQQSCGRELPPHLQIAWSAAKVQPGEVVLDIGCGRGEILLHSALAGASAVCGLDFSPDATRMSARTVGQLSGDQSRLVSISQADAMRLPFRDTSFDVIFWLDVIEHLAPDQVATVLREAKRVLKPQGRFVLHTAPNLWFMKYGYHLMRALSKKARTQWPPDPFEAWASARHVNEQSLRSLKQVLKEHGFSARVWLAKLLPYAPASLKSRCAHWVLYDLPPFLYLFRNDVYAVARHRC